MISKDALFEELLLIKAAEEETPSKWQSEFIPLAKHRLKGMVPFALGTGVGMGMGYLGGQLARKYLPQGFIRRYSRPIGAVAGGLLGGSAAALHTAQRRLDDEEEEMLRAIRERNRQSE